MDSVKDNLLGPIKTIIAEELPENYSANVDLVFGSLDEAQEDSFKLVIKLSSKKPTSKTERIDWSYRINQRIHEKYGNCLLISTRMPGVSA